MADVLFLTRILTHYRMPFHNDVRRRLAEAGITYRLAYSQPQERLAKKQDVVALDWAEEIPITYFGNGGYCWQSLPRGIGKSALVIIGQESKLLHNYFLQMWRPLGGPRLAYFGHGKHFQARNQNAPNERFKRFLIDKVDWWFAYTPRCADEVAGKGFPRDRITIFNNAIDTSSIKKDLAQLDQARQSDLRLSLAGGSRNVGVFVGGMYADKRLEFLLEASSRVRAAVPDFHLLMIGGGEDAHIAQEAAQRHDWVHYLGPKFGAEKNALVSLGRVFLMPGLVGLGILDSFAYGTPMVTTDFPYHSPEIDYLEDGKNGVIVKTTGDPQAYADAVIRVLVDDKFRTRLQKGAQSALATYTIEAMAERFAAGVRKALEG